MHETRDLGPAVPFPPPLVYVIGVGGAQLLQRVVPLPLWIPDTRLVTIGGAALAVLGLGLMFTGILTFRRFRTAVYPNRPAKVLVDTGVYAHTRNPMYAGMTTAYLGGVLLTGSMWMVVLLPIVLLVIRTQVIAREERHLTTQFPEAYTAYCARVRRWV